MTDAKPYPKAQQLARGERRHKRKVASAATWQKIADAKRGPCRVCTDPASNGRLYGRIQFHHIVPRVRGGDDVADNICSLCPSCHDLVTRRDPDACGALLSRLRDAEYAYGVTKFGEGIFESVYGLKYEGTR